MFLGKSAPRKLRKSRIDQANAIEEESDEKLLKCIREDVLAEDEDSKEGKNIRYRRCTVLHERSYILMIDFQIINNNHDV